MTDAQLMIQKPSLLVSAVNMIDALPLDRGRHQGRSLRVPAQQADHGRHQRPVPHAPAHHPADGRAARAEADRDHRRPGLRHGRLPRRRDAVPAGEVHARPRASSSHDDGEKTYTGDLLEPYRKHIQNGDVPRLRLRHDDAPHRVHEPDAPRRRDARHPLPGHAQQLVPRAVSRTGRRTAST